MATTTPWLPGWPAVRPRRRAAGARAIPAPPGPLLARGERVLFDRGGVIATDRALYCGAAVDDGPVGDTRGPDRALATVAGAPFPDGVLRVGGTSPAGGAGEWTRLGWERIARADRHERGLVLTAWAPGLPPRTIIDVARATRLLALARERIAWTTLIATRVEIAGRPVRIAARRAPATDEVLWLVALDPAVGSTADVRAELEEALARLRREFAGR